MFSLLTACISCYADTHLKFFPLCRLCSESLSLCPPLCPNCASPLCISQKQCTRPWISNTQIQSYSARYLLLDRSYEVLKTWKKRRGPIFDRIVLNLDDLKIEFPHVEAIVPIPQHFYRAWKLRGSPSEVLSQKLSKKHRTPIIKALNLATLQSPQIKRQAQLTLVERIQNPIRYEIRLGCKKLKSVLLVDDFMTTGHTLKSAAQLLRTRLGVREVHVFCLGIRAPHLHFESKQRTDLMNSIRKTISIC